MSQSRQLAAIMFTDIVGYTALMGEDEERAFDLLHKNRDIQQPLIKQFHGKWIKEIGDGILASFSTATDAVECAVAIQQACNSLPELKLHIGVHLGEVVFEKGDVFGDGVNIASRLESMAPPGDILITEAVYANIKNKKEFEIEFFGEEVLKNVEDPVKIYRVIIGINTIENTHTIHIKKINQKGKVFNERNLIPFLLVLILLIALGLYYYFNHQNINNTTELAAKKSMDTSIAVLPFTNMSNDPEQEYFADGMMDEILNHLFKIGGLRIISRTSAMAYRGTKKPMKDIASDLGVAHLLEGSVQKEGQRIRIRVQLIDGKTDEHLWAETYDREFKDVFAIQSEIAQKVAFELKVKIDPDVKRRIELQPTANTEAYNLFLKALDYNNPPEKRKTLLEAAIALDSTFADAYAEIAGGYWIFGGGHDGILKPEEIIKNAEPLLKKAFELNPDLTSAHLYLTLMDLWYKWDFDKVQSEYEKILYLNPSNPEVTVHFTEFLFAQGKFKEGFDLSAAAFAKDSSSYFHRAQLALGYYYINNPKKALQTIETAAIFFDKNSWVLLNAIRVNNYVGEYKNAILHFEKYKANYKLIPYVLGHAAIAYYKTGQKDSSEKFLNEIKKESQKLSVGSPSFFIAAVYTAMGKNDLAIQWLEKAYKDHEVEMYWLKVEPLFKPLHNDIRFQDILNKIGYP